MFTINTKRNIALFTLLLLLTICLVRLLLAIQTVRSLVAEGEGLGYAAPNTYRAVLISQEANNPYWKAVENGARDAAARGGWSLQYVGPQRIDPEEQLRLLEKAIASRADAVLLQGTGDPRYRERIDEAVRSGMLVVTVDADEPNSGRQAYVGTNNVEAGKAIGELAAAGGRQAPLRIGVLIGDERAPNQAQRLQGLRRAIAGSPDVEIVQVASSSISRLRAASAAERMLRGDPDIDVMAGLSSLDGIGILEAATREGMPKPLIFAFDDLPETIEAIRGGGIAASIVQQPTRMGQLAMELAMRGAKGMPVPEYTYTDIDVLTRGELEPAEGDHP